MDGIQTRRRSRRLLWRVDCVEADPNSKTRNQNQKPETSKNTQARTGKQKQTEKTRTEETENAKAQRRKKAKRKSEKETQNLRCTPRDASPPGTFHPAPSTCGSSQDPAASQLVSSEKTDCWLQTVVKMSDSEPRNSFLPACLPARISKQHEDTAAFSPRSPLCYHSVSEIRLR